MESNEMLKDIGLLLNPKSVAIVGASEDFSKWGGMVFGSLITHGYNGKIFPINPKYKEIKGIECFPNLAEVRDDVDMACVIVARRFVLEIMEQCAEKGIRAVTIYTAGYAEAGEVELQNELISYAKAAGIRILGPQSIGFINVAEKVATYPSIDWKPLVSGQIGLITKSGGFAVLFDRAQERGIHFSYLVHTGNEGDLDDTDFLRFMVEDPKTKAIIAFNEGIKDPQKFLVVADQALRKEKPIIIYKVGRSEKGAKAAASHTGSLSGEDAVYEAVFKQKGIIRAFNVDDMFNIASAFVKCKRPKGNRVGAVTVSGGGVGVLADKCNDLNIPIPDLSPTSKEKLTEMLEYGAVANPIDITGQATHIPDMYLKTLNIFLEDPNFDIVIPMIEQPRVEIRGTYAVNAASSTDKTILAWYLGRSDHPGLKELEKSPIPVFQTAEECLTAVKALTQYTEFLNSFFPTESEAIRITVPLDQTTKAKLFPSGKKSLSAHECKTLLSHYGILTLRGELATSLEEALSISERIGFPIVLKAESPQILHKTEANAVKTNISSESELSAAYTEICNNVRRYQPDARISGILIQEMANAFEAIAGIYQDAQFGPVIMFGLGGIFVEVLKDYSLRVAPLTKKEARNMIEETKAFDPLRPFRGQPAKDLLSLIDTLQRLSELSIDLKEDIQEIDINPLFIFEEGKGVKAGDVRILLKTEAS